MSDFEDPSASSSSPPPTAAQTNGDADVDFPEDAASDPETVQVTPGQDVTSAVLGASDSLEGLSLRAQAPSPSVPREEPETIKAWRAEQEKRLEEKDQKEQEMMEDLREKAKKELQDWYKKYDEQLEKTKGDNRTSEKTFVAQTDEIEPGTEWDRVSKLCEFNSKKQNSARDMSRMRSVLLQLKQNPKPVLQAAN